MLLRSIVLCYCLVLVGCLGGKGTAERAAAPNADVLPRGVIPPSSDGSVDSTGIFPGSVPDDPDCCWIGPSAAFQVGVPANARALILTVLVPDLKPFHDRSQSLSVSVDHGPARRFDHLPIGLKTLRVPLALQATGRVSDVALHAGFTFSPKKANITGDTRELALYLKSATTE